MEIKILQEINEDDVAKIAACRLIDNEGSMSLIEAIEEAIYESEGVYMTVTQEAVVQLKSMVIDKLTNAIININNECVN
jgi:hypothetical protein